VGLRRTHLNRCKDGEREPLLHLGEILLRATRAGGGTGASVLRRQVAVNGLIRQIHHAARARPGSRAGAARLRREKRIVVFHAEVF
tara:strand:+ start:1292 stop:1549 length:258 start_codon:yes stop_codon:yes gene_type:complete